MKRTYLLALLVACGDNGKIAGQPDSGPSIDAAPAQPRAIVVAGDFVTPGFSGVMSKLEISTLQMTQNVAPAGSIGNDPVLRLLGDELYVVNRAAGNNVTIFNPRTLEVLEQLSTGANSNPQDVAVFGNTLFLPALGSKGVVVVTRGSTTIEEIDLSNLDPDGNPDCNAIHRVGNDIYVACGLLDPANFFTARGPGKIVIIDAPAKTRKATLTLSQPNPFGGFTELPNNGGLVIPTFDYTAPATRCLEQIKVGPTPFAMGCMIQHSTLGGYIARATTQKFAGSNMLWMIVNNGDFNAEKARLWGYDLDTSTLWDAPLTPETQVLTDMAPCPNGQVVVADKTIAANGLRVYEGGVEKTTDVMPIGLRPQSSPAIACY